MIEQIGSIAATVATLVAARLIWRRARRPFTRLIVIFTTAWVVAVVSAPLVDQRYDTAAAAGASVLFFVGGLCWLNLFLRQRRSAHATESDTR